MIYVILLKGEVSPPPCHYVITFFINPNFKNMKKFLLFAAAALIASSASAKWVSIIDGGKAADGETATLQAGWTGPAKVVDNPKGEGKVFECPIAENEANGDGNFDDWKSQMFICFAEPVQEGDVVKVTFDNYCTDSRTVGMQAQGDRGTYQGNFQGFEAKNEWQTYSQEITVTSQFAGNDGFKTIAICLSSKAEAATFYVNNVVVEKQVADDVTPVEPEKQVIASMYPGNEQFIAWGCDGLLTQNVEIDGRVAAKFDQTAEGKNPWDVQFAYDYDYAPGTKYYFSFEVKGEPAGSVGSGFQCTDGWVGCGDVETFNITSDWTKVLISGTPNATEDGKLPNRWVASIGSYIGTFYISNVEIYFEKAAAVETIAPVKANTAVYNLQGVKVANSLEEVAAPGLYISNGKKIIKK